jgi:hypothetical protein
MFRSIGFRYALAAAFVFLMGCAGLAAPQQSDNDQDKHLDIHSSAGDLHVGGDADAQKAGFPLYPGARLRHEKDSDNANVGLLTEAFGIKFVIAKYESDDSPEKIIDYYRKRLEKYGKVVECHTKDHGDMHADFDDDEDHSDHRSKEVTCEGDNSGPITELKVGTERNQHVVSIEPLEGHGSKFTLVYVHTRGKQSDI